MWLRIAGSCPCLTPVRSTRIFPSFLVLRLTKKKLSFYLQVKDTFKSLPSGELALRAQKQTLEQIRRNIAGKAKLLTTKETFMVHWLQEYFRSSS